MGSCRDQPATGASDRRTYLLRRRAADLIKAQRYESLTLYLDNDQAGRSASAYLKAETRRAAITDASGEYAGHNDLNDWLRAMRRR